MNHKEQIEREAEKEFPRLEDMTMERRAMQGALQNSFIQGANFALEMVLKELEAQRTEVIQINGLRTDVVAWPDIEALLGKFNAGF